jgi:hypothetical protein
VSSDASGAAALTDGGLCAQGTCVDAAGTLSGVRCELACTGAPDDKNVCPSNAARLTTSTLNGASGASYDVTLRVRGVVEQKTYIGGAAGVATGSKNPQMFRVGGDDNGDHFNIYRLVVSQPAQTFHLNSGTSSIYTCFPVDYSVTIRMAAGATITLSGDPKGVTVIANKDSNGNAVVVPDVPPAPAAFNGQFVQIDVVSVVPAA